LQLERSAARATLVEPSEFQNQGTDESDSAVMPACALG